MPSREPVNGAGAAAGTGAGTGAATGAGRGDATTAGGWIWACVYAGCGRGDGSTIGRGTSADGVRVSGCASAIRPLALGSAGRGSAVRGSTFISAAGRFIATFGSGRRIGGAAT